MHADELDIDASLVRRMLARQFPEWGELPIEPVESAGTENAIFRLGRELTARLPRRPHSAAPLENAHRWVPLLAPRLPLAAPLPVALGEADEEFPVRWSVQRWLDGAPATPETLNDLGRAAVDLAGFIRALRRIDVDGGPRSARGRPLAALDEGVREAIGALRAKVDTDAVTGAWEAALAVPEWSGPPRWFHGDLYDGNLLAVGGRLAGVLDFGAAGVGDPACDLIVAWSLFSGDTRAVFRDALGVDDAMWARGRGWALAVALNALPYYADTNPVMVANSTRRVSEVLAES
jgi:aminoglycoside phosphotransferase (APT) family kinase protein